MSSSTTPTTRLCDSIMRATPQPRLFKFLIINYYKSKLCLFCPKKPPIETLAMKKPYYTE